MPGSTPTIPEARWRKLVVRFGVSGVKVHDARLVALMLANDIPHILTFNAADFQRYEAIGIRAIHPDEVEVRASTRSE